MILDERTQFCAATALNTGAAGSTLLGNVIDLGRNGLDLGGGEPLWLVIQVAATATSAGAATASFKLVSDAQPAIATDGSATVHLVTDPQPVASLTAGRRVCVLALPPGRYERYLGLLQLTATAAFTGGAIHAFLTTAPEAWQAAADA